MNAKTKTRTTMYKWTACNPYSYLNGVVEARTLPGAVRAGRKYVEDEPGGEKSAWYMPGSGLTLF